MLANTEIAVVNCHPAEYLFGKTRPVESNQLVHLGGNKMQKHLSALAVAGALAVATVLGGFSAYAADQIDVAIIVPLSGPNGSVGEQAVNAAKLAVTDINGAGGIKSSQYLRLWVAVPSRGLPRE